MTLKIDCTFDEGKTRLRLSGDLRSGHLDQVGDEIAKAKRPVSLDLQEITHIDVDGIRLLNRCQEQQISITNCASYIREWMQQEATNQKR